MVKKLEKYTKKRDFSRTPEPKPHIKKNNSQSIFVIQQHHASHMHYDFRLEVDGVLKSWALPKGPSTNPHDKRLAAPTEDHPLEYVTFEGIIPEGYGAGTVIVWDTGPYENISEKNGKKLSMQQAYDAGHITIFLRGKKLQGGYTLIKFKERAWLFIKTNDKHADARRNPVKTQSKSVLSDHTIKELDSIYKKNKTE